MDNKISRKFTIRTQGDIKERYDEIVEILEDGKILVDNKMEPRYQTIDVTEKAQDVVNIIKDMQLTYFELNYFLELIETMALDRWIR